MSVICTGKPSTVNGLELELVGAAVVAREPNSDIPGKIVDTGTGATTPAGRGRIDGNGIGAAAGAGTGIGAVVVLTPGGRGNAEAET